MRIRQTLICIAGALFCAAPPADGLRKAPAPSVVASGQSGAHEDILPPNVLYHFGQRSHLVENARAGTVPQDVWDKYIMGESTTFRSHPFRRGLYGTVHPAFADTFGEWFMAVHLTSECRSQTAVVIPSDLYLDTRLEHWYAQRLVRPMVTIEQFTRQCFRESSPLDGVSPRLFLKVKNVVDSAESPGACETLLEQFYGETGARVVLDEQWMEQDFIGVNLVNHVSWYIRDRDCIEDIQGQETDVVRMIASLKDFWDDQEVLRITDDEHELVESSRAVQRAYPLRMLMIALAEFPESASDEDLATIRASAAEGHRHLQPLNEGARTLVPPVIDAFLRCRRASNTRDFRNEVPDRDFDVTLIPAVVERLKRICDS